MPDYSEAIRRIYDDYTIPRIEVTREMVYKAAFVTESRFPPADKDDVFAILAALNLLNTVVKLPWGRKLVTYNYIKGLAAAMFTELTFRKIEGIDLYYDRGEDIVYFRVYDIQISFHHPARYGSIEEAIIANQLTPQQWDGLRLQKVAAELFHMAVPKPPVCSTVEKAYLQGVMKHAAGGLLKESPLKEKCMEGSPSDEGLMEEPALEECAEEKECILPTDSYSELQMILNFNIWRCNKVTLHHRKDHRDVPIIRYTGQNYDELTKFLTQNRPYIPRRYKSAFLRGCLYCISAKLRIIRLPVSQYIMTLTQNSFIKKGGRLFNLCLSYSMARYLSMLFPNLMFVNTLDYNRMATSSKKYYATKDIATVPMTSKARQLKVWIAIDIGGELTDFDPYTLPEWLVSDYANTDIFFREFEKIRKNGHVGILAYREILLLPPVYRRIDFAGYQAYVKRDDGKVAVYSLHKEAFISDFVYDRVWYENLHCAVMGMKDGKITVIYQFLPEIFAKVVKKRIKSRHRCMIDGMPATVEWFYTCKYNPPQCNQP